MPLVLLIVLGGSIISFGKYAWGYRGDRDKWLLKSVSATATAYAMQPLPGLSVLDESLVLPTVESAGMVVPVPAAAVESQGFARIEDELRDQGSSAATYVISDTGIMSPGVSVYHEGPIVDPVPVATAPAAPAAPAGDRAAAYDMVDPVASVSAPAGEPITYTTVITIIAPSGVRVDVIPSSD